MSQEFSDQSEIELLALINRAEQELERRKAASKGRLKMENEEKLRQAGLELNDLFSAAASKVRKARPPLWVKRIMAERDWTLEVNTTKSVYSRLNLSSSYRIFVKYEVKYEIKACQGDLSEILLP